MLSSTKRRLRATRGGLAQPRSNGRYLRRRRFISLRSCRVSVNLHLAQINPRRFLTPRSARTIDRRGGGLGATDILRTSQVNWRTRDAKRDTQAAGQEEIGSSIGRGIGGHISCERYVEDHSFPQ